MYSIVSNGDKVFDRIADFSCCQDVPYIFLFWTKISDFLKVSDRLSVYLLLTCAAATRSVPAGFSAGQRRSNDKPLQTESGEPARA